MKKLSRQKKGIVTSQLFKFSTFLLLLVVFIQPAVAQTLTEEEQRILQFKSNIQTNWCGTKDLPHNKFGKAEDVKIINRLMQLKDPGNTWSLTDGYGSGCTKNCVIEQATTCSGPQSELFRLPVVYTVSTTSGCASNAPSTTELTAMIDIMNDFYICEGMDLEYYLPTNIAAAPGGFRMGDFGCDYSAASISDIAGVVNIYVFSDTGNGTGCNGFAPLPFSTGSDIDIAMSHNCYNGFTYTQGSMNCANVGSLGSGQVLIHELGHYLGLYHTHDTGGECGDDPTTTADDCTNGDFIQDTDEDPDYSGGEIGCLGCDTGGPQPNCSFGNSGSAECSPYLNGGNPPNTINNIMSYNLFSGCINEFSECQKAKMMDALLCVRGLQACARNVDEEFANGAMDAHQEICLGDAIPTFMATSGCYNWYDDLGSSATLLASGMTFTPSAAQVDVNTPGVYNFYLGDWNESNPDCRTTVSVTVLGEPGDGSVNGGASVVLTSCPDDISLATNVSVLNENGIVGWWITEDNPISAIVTNQSTLDANTPNPSTIFGIGNIVKATGGTPPNSLTLSVDCGTLDDTKTYYLTPTRATFRAAIPDENCVVPGNGTQGITFNGFPGKFNVTDPNNVCVPNPVMTPPSFTYCITVSGFTGNPNNLSLIIRDDYVNGNTLLSDWFLGTGDGTYCYTDADMPGYDPGSSSLSQGMTGIVWEQGGSGMQNATVSTSLDITYPGSPEIPFPSISTYDDCLFGTPVSFTCNCSSSCPPTVDLPTDPAAPIVAGTYESSGTITSSNNVATGTTVIFNGATICLENGFEVELGAVFESNNQPCTPLASDPTEE